VSIRTPHCKSRLTNTLISLQSSQRPAGRSPASLIIITERRYRSSLQLKGILISSVPVCVHHQPHGLLSKFSQKLSLPPFTHSISLVDKYCMIDDCPMVMKISIKKSTPFRVGRRHLQITIVCSCSSPSMALCYTSHDSHLFPSPCFNGFSSQPQNIKTWDQNNNLTLDFSCNHGRVEKLCQPEGNGFTATEYQNMGSE